MTEIDGDNYARASDATWASPSGTIKYAVTFDGRVFRIHDDGHMTRIPDADLPVDLNHDD